MSTLSQLADMIEDFAELDLLKTPGVRFRTALLSRAKDADFGIPYDVARIVVLRMEVNITEFDYDNNYCVRIIDGYALMISKIYNSYGSGILEMERLSITYNV